MELALKIDPAAAARLLEGVPMEGRINSDLSVWSVVAQRWTSRESRGGGAMDCQPPGWEAQRLGFAGCG